MNAIERLEAIEEIRTLKSRYFRYVDGKRWEEFRLLFTDDAHFDVARGAIEGPDAFVAAVAERMSPQTLSIHHGHTPEIEITGPSSAEGIWTMADRVTWPPGEDHPLASGAPDEYGFAGFGRYEERYRRVEDGWRICELKIVRSQVEILTGVPAPTRTMG